MNTNNNNKIEDYIDPNHLMGREGKTFIYTVNNNLYFEDSSISHKAMLENDKLWMDLLTFPNGTRYEKLISVPGNGFQRRAFAENNSILGRTGLLGGKRTVSFWGDKAHFVRSHIKNCVKKLIEESLVDENTEVFSLVFKKTTIKNILEDRLEEKEKNKKEYKIKGETYSWDFLRELRTRTHNNPNKKELDLLCNLLTPDVIKKYPELRCLIPTKCTDSEDQAGDLPRYLSAGKVPNWGPVYPTIGDSTMHFKKWLLEN